MTLNDIVLKTIESRLQQVDVDAFCQQEQTTMEAFCDAFARYVAVGYMNGSFNYVEADSAIAGLFNHFFPETPAFTTSVYICFDTAEYRRTQGTNPDEVARPLITNLLASQHQSLTD